jgi:hypothetical protein
MGGCTRVRRTLTIVHGHLLHESVVDGSIPQQEGGCCNGEAVAERDSHVCSTRAEACKEHQHTGEKVEEQCYKQSEPEVVQDVNCRLVCFWNLGWDGPISYKG